MIFFSTLILTQRTWRRKINITPQVQDDIYSAAQRIESSDPYQRPVYQPEQPVLQPQNNALLNELNDNNQAPKPKIDTSFLDDLL